ncbi:hypothetical protein V6Z12_D08G185500 [Gossypium hirsutum]|uniref:Uncharacterized protein isoform X5 n=1 Tax=Gossypium hirsutum TaxID=3635 RepID=A0A1U8IUX8_GOSHI|nr:uncharacterized protein LOC107900694 isoform X5 [Gossypium hirsutum]
MGSRNGGGAPTMIRRRQSDFKMSFNLALRSLLTTCSKEARILVKNFQNLQVQSKNVSTSVYSAFNQWRYGSYSGHYHFAWEYRGRTALDTVGQLVEEQCLDHFFSDNLI